MKILTFSITFFLTLKAVHNVSYIFHGDIKNYVDKYNVEACIIKITVHFNFNQVDFRIVSNLNSIKKLK